MDSFLSPDPYPARAPAPTRDRYRSPVRHDPATGRSPRRGRRALRCPSVKRYTAAATAATAAAALALSPVSPAHASPPAELLGSAVVDHGTRFQGTPVGGLSGIDRDPRTGDYLLISDDRSEQAPARFYTARIGVDADGVRGIAVTGLTTLRDRSGRPYAPQTVDPESVRLDPATGQVWWTTEGDRRIGDGRPVLRHPQVRAADADGRTRRALPPAHPRLRMSRHETGPRANLTFEGMDLASDGTVVTAMEGPLYQDGPRTSPDHGAPVRITVTDRRGRLLSQHAYPADPAAAEPDPADGHAENGVTSILEDPESPGEFLVLERDYVQGVGNSVRVYRTDLDAAPDVSRVWRLPGDPDHRLIADKEPVLDLSALGLEHVDNVEGMTWGPRLDDGRRTLVLVSDDNFSSGQVTQVVAVALG